VNRPNNRIAAQLTKAQQLELEYRADRVRMIVKAKPRKSTVLDEEKKLTDKREALHKKYLADCERLKQKFYSLEAPLNEKIKEIQRQQNAEIVSQFDAFDADFRNFREVLLFETPEKARELLHELEAKYLNQEEQKKN
jgi:hypothetical protein